MNNLISICIPTYNRDSLLKESLVKLISQIREFSIPIYISDNYSCDNTEKVVKELSNNYKYLFYHKNSKNIGLDRNFESVLRLPKTKYSWLLGDDDRIRTKSITQILESISNNNYDFVVLNGGFENKPFIRVKDIQTQIYKDRNLILSELGWHMTWMSSLIFNNKNIEKMYFSPHYDSLFSHIGAIFNFLSKKDHINVYWLNKPTFYPSSKAIFSWSSVIFKVFVKNWTDIILNLPKNYSHESKINCIKKHGLESGLFTLVGFLNLRSKNAFNFKSFREYRLYFDYITNIPSSILLFISIFPVKILYLISLAFKTILNKLK
jgi:abequosyltransferase